MFENYNHLGFRSPYYFKDKSDKICVFTSFNEILKNKGGTYSELDINGVIQVLSRYHCFGNRTLIKDIKRTPWMAKPSPDLSSWDHYKIPSHDQIVESPDKIAQNLERLLENELLSYIHQAKKVGVLLSGGMDSRILAAILHNLQNKHSLNIEITGLTWGMIDSRDVVYAKTIADLLNWNWKHFELSAENLKENISVTAAHGCEISPLHLHAMPKVRDFAQDFDCIVAASYGDSIGRGEYSGRHISNLKPVEKYVRNWFGLIKNKAFIHYKDSAKRDAKIYRQHYNRRSKIEELEIEKQSQYMRRQLNSCFSIIEEACPVHQIFTDPKTFEYIWSLSHKCRNDVIYEKLLENLNLELLKVPWARTGLKYGTNKGDGDDFKKNHSVYGKWIREDLNSHIAERVLSTHIEKISIFNIESIEKLLEVQQNHFHNTRHTKVDEVLIWIASLSEMIEKYEIMNFDFTSDLQDYFSKTIRTKTEALVYNEICKFRGYY